MGTDTKEKELPKEVKDKFSEDINDIIKDNNKKKKKLTEQNKNLGRLKDNL